VLDLTKEISRLEERTNATILALRYWQASRFSASEGDARVLMQRANHTALTAHRKSPSNIDLYTLAIFLAIEAGHYDSANEMLDKAMGFRSFLRANAPRQYAELCFLYAYLEINQKRYRSAKKHWRLMTDHIRNIKPCAEYTIMQGLLHLAAEEYGDAYGYLREAFLAGSNSIFLYEGLYRFYCKTPHKPEGTAILAILIYAAGRGVDIAKLALSHQNALFNAIAANPEAGEHLYNISGYPPLLSVICTSRISMGDVSATAYAYYKDAENKQIFVHGLFSAIVHGAYENKATHINHYALSQFLQTAEMNAKLAVYIYHIILTSPHLADLLPQQQARILQLAADCLQAGTTGHEVNSLYYYFWSRCRLLSITGTSVDQAEEILRRELTMFRVSAHENSLVRYVYITEPEKRGMVVCDMQNEIIIEASGQAISYTCLGAQQRAIFEEELSISRMVPGADAELYQYFFNKGDRRFYLLTFLTNYYLEYETPPDAAIPVFEAMLAERAITKAYRMRILVTLGQLHYNAFSFDQALECYGELDEDALENDFTKQILNVYMQTHEAERAVRLVSKKHSYICGDILLDAICTLLTKPVNHAPLAEAAYKLLLGGYYREQILDLVLDHHQGSYSEWVALARELYNSGFLSMRLNMRILETAIWMTCWDADMQQAFVQVYTQSNLCDEQDKKHSQRLLPLIQDGEAPHPTPNCTKAVQGTSFERLGTPAELALAALIDDFIEYATYEILANDLRPEYEVLEILENHRDTLLTWGLASCYLRHNITTRKSEEVLADAIDELENAGILFPIFKEAKFARIPYIEKFQPFVYRGLPNKEYNLNYRTNDDMLYTAIPMQYVKYGLYVACLPLFYNEEVTYFFSEEMPTGSIATKTQTIKNTTPFLHDHPTDQFFAINNALVYEQMFKHDQVEKAVAGLVKEVQDIRGRLL